MTNMPRSIAVLGAALGFAFAVGPIASTALAAPATASHATYSALHAKGGGCDNYQSIVTGLQGAVAAGVTDAVGAEQNVRQSAAADGCKVY
jgi:hypothetical protein